MSLSRCSVRKATLFSWETPGLQKAVLEEVQGIWVKIWAWKIILRVSQMLGKMSQACLAWEWSARQALKQGLKKNTRVRQAWTLTHPPMKFSTFFYYVKELLWLFVLAAGNVLRAGMKAGSWICQGQRDMEQGRSCAPGTATVTCWRNDQRPSACLWCFDDINAFSKISIVTL